MVVFVDDSENVELETTLQISRPDQVHLLDIVVMNRIFFRFADSCFGLFYQSVLF